MLSLRVNSPIPQVLHADCPSISWYCPLLQFEHTLAPADETLPALQAIQEDAVVCPVALPYLPFSQSVHAPDASMYLPAAHTIASHDDSAVCPVRVEVLPTPQSMNDAALDCPVRVPYLPAPQDVHPDSLLAPVATPYLPAVQDVHLAAAYML